jgi:catalase (peroxidase I)
MRMKRVGAGTVLFVLRNSVAGSNDAVSRRGEAIQKDFNGAQSSGKRVSIADLIVLGGCTFERVLES